MARFLIVVYPLPSHLYAPVAIGQALADAGHQVAWCGPETDLRPLVGEQARIYPTGKRYYRAVRRRRRAEAARKLWPDVLVPLNRFISSPPTRRWPTTGRTCVVVDQYAVAGALVARTGTGCGGPPCAPGRWS